MFDEGFATGSCAVVDELCSPELVDHQLGLAGTETEAAQHVRDAMSDLSRELHRDARCSRGGRSDRRALGRP